MFIYINKLMNVHSVSLIGLRNQNEDKHIAILNGDGHNQKIAPVNMFGVFDGHGGKEVSAFLHKHLPKCLVDARIPYPLKKSHISPAYNYIQDLLIKNYPEISKHTGSTACVAIHYVSNNFHYLTVINVGDSRCVLCRDNIGIALSKDHKPHWPEEKARIENTGGTIYFDGNDWRIKDLSVSRAFGDVDATPCVTHVPDIFKYKLNKSDKFFILACDGLWDVATNQEIVNFVLTHCYDKKMNTRINKDINIARKLADYALAKGSSDNITVIVVFMNWDV
jgi:serine/threonine protein phosphatase PrpC